MEEGLLDNVDYFVEGDGFIMDILKEKFEKELGTWERHAQGFGVSTKDTHISFYFSTINGHLVCFYYPTSTRIDWADVESYLEPWFNKCGHCQARAFPPQRLLKKK